MAVNLAKGKAPIILFGYNRPAHIQQTLNALNKNELASLSELFIFLDGPGSKAHHENCRAVQDICNTFPWIGVSKKVIVRPQNLGLAENIISGVSEILEHYESAIVLEDDLVTSKGFLTYMNEALTLYRNEKQVMHISGYMFPVEFKSADKTVFYQVTTSWSWATWADRWKYFNPDANVLLNQLKKRKLTYWFDLDGSGIFLSQLEQNVSGKLHTWAIKWMASVTLRNGISLHPTKSLVRNIGFDDSGTNCGVNEIYTHQEIAEHIPVKPIPLELNQKLRKRMIRFYRPPGPLKRAVARLKSLLKKM